MANWFQRRSSSRRYRVLVKGIHYVLDYEGVNTWMGFYTTRYVNAPTPESAMELAIEAVAQEIATHRPLNPSSDPSRLEVDECEEVTGRAKGPNRGFTFYIEGKDDAECDPVADQDDQDSRE